MKSPTARGQAEKTAEGDFSFKTNYDTEAFSRLGSKHPIRAIDGGMGKAQPFAAAVQNTLFF